MPPEFLEFAEKEFKNGEFVLVPGRQLKQAYRRIGDFDKYENETLFYERGEYCANPKGYARAELKIVCGPVEKFVRVWEIAGCRYGGAFATPAVCSREKTELLETLSLGELRRIAADL
jgi:hypothetical protein